MRLLKIGDYIFATFTDITTQFHNFTDITTQFHNFTAWLNQFFPKMWITNVCGSAEICLIFFYNSFLLPMWWIKYEYIINGSKIILGFFVIVFSPNYRGQEVQLIKCEGRRNGFISLGFLIRQIQDCWHNWWNVTLKIF
jgi:hypothetical protein